MRKRGIDTFGTFLKTVKETAPVAESDGPPVDASMRVLHALLPGTVSVGSLIRGTGLSFAELYHVVDDLERYGLVEFAADSKEKTLTLTDEGRKAADLTASAG